MPKLFEAIPLAKSELNESLAFFAGIECEIESVQTLETDDPLTYFNAENDGSLRNHGIEYISVPLPRDKLVNQFKNLHANIVYYDKSVAFSPRTSTHVHVNVRRFEPQQLRHLLLFYALFEECFFNMVDPIRRDNIHCVALTETAYPARYRHDILHMAKNWHKYTAFNLLPLFNQGSIEFRHLQGTDDAELLNRWLCTIENLWLLAQRDVMDKHSIVDPQQHLRWFHAIFKDAPEILALEPAMPNIIANNLIDVKMAFI
jgi:hypothetical protein